MLLLKQKYVLSVAIETNVATTVCHSVYLRLYWNKSTAVVCLCFYSNKKTFSWWLLGFVYWNKSYNCLFFWWNKNNSCWVVLLLKQKCFMTVIVVFYWNESSSCLFVLLLKQKKLSWMPFSHFIDEQLKISTFLFLFFNLRQDNVFLLI